MKKIDKYPKVSVIIPCFNEENTISLLLKAIQEQAYPLSQLEVVISDSLSTDTTRNRIEEFIKQDAKIPIKVIDNHKRTIPSGVNLAASHADGDILVRLDAHSEPNKEYINTSVELLMNGVADNVGGIWEIKPGDDTCIAKAIAKSAAHPLAVGDAKYRISLKAQFVDTVPFGAFFKRKFIEVGCLDESLLANEDYEFNARLIARGGRVRMDPRIRSKYYARNSLKALAKQYWRYGFWKVKMLKRYPSTIRWRQAIPPLFVASLILLGILSTALSFARIILVGELSIYLIALSLVGLHSAIKWRNICYLLMPLAIITMHVSWGCGFIYSLISPINKSKK